MTLVPDINVASFNVGVLYDCKTVLLRTAPNSTDEKTQRTYREISEIHQQAMAVYNQRENKGEWWEHPDYQVTKEQHPIISELRQQKLKEIFSNTLFPNNEIVFLQEVENLNDIDFVKTQLPENFDFAYGKENITLKDGKQKIAYDTFVCWNKTRLLRVAQDEQKETPFRRATCITLYDTLSKKTFEVASVHFQGFNLLNPKFSPKTDDGFLEGDSTVDLLSTIFNEHNELSKADVTIIGGDLNAEYNPDYIQDEESLKLHTRRFTLLERDFKRVDIPTKHHTAYNKDLVKIAGHENGLCTIDHFFVKTSEEDIKAVPNSDLNNASSIEDISMNPSDHRFLSMKIKFP